MTCSPRVTGGPSYCQACYGQDESAPDANHDNVPDFGECCSEEMFIFRGPQNELRYVLEPVCSTLRGAGMSCNNNLECRSADGLFCYEPGPRVVGQETPYCSGRRPDGDFCRNRDECLSDNCEANHCYTPPEIR